jgi:hypothetical protein
MTVDLNRWLGDNALLLGPRPKEAGAKKTLTSHDVKDVTAVAILAVEQPAWRLNDLPVPPTLEPLGLGAASGMISKLLDVLEHSLDQLPSGLWILQRDVICDGIQVIECGLGPDYLSHRAMRCLALA